MARILFLLRQLEAGGAERQLIGLSRGLVRLGHEIMIAVWVPGGRYECDLSGTGIQYRVIAKRGTNDFPRFFLNVVRLVRQFQPEVIHGYLDCGNFLAAALRPLFPKARIAWGIRNSGQEIYDFRGKAVFAVSGLMARLPHLIISNSQAGAEHARACGYPPARTHVIPNGIDTEFFRPDLKRGASLRREWGLGPEVTVIGLAARLDPVKEDATFAAAARMLCKRRPEVRFVCVGDGIEPYRSAALAYLRTVDLNDRVRWEGYVSDMPAFFNALDLATSTSTAEGFSNAIAEAMACGVSCVATDVGDARTIIGDTGRVVPPGDAASLAAAWQDALESRTHGPNLECRARIVEHFSVSRLVTDTERLILPPASRRSPSVQL